jgi:hypothetical protein
MRPSFRLCLTVLRTLDFTPWSCWLPPPGVAAASCLRSNGATWMKRPAKSAFPSRWNKPRRAFGSKARNQKRRGVSPSPNGTRGPACAPTGPAARSPAVRTYYDDHNLIFCQPGGAYYSPDRLGARVVELMRKGGLEGVSLHSLRHSHATILVSDGVPVAVDSERLGHADQNITLSLYSHALPADTRAAAKIWNDSMADVIADARRTRPASGSARPARRTGTAKRSAPLFLNQNRVAQIRLRRH